MKYLIIDGMLSGTGIRDGVEGGYIEPADLGLSEQLCVDIASWVELYAQAHYRQYSDQEMVD